MALTITLTSVEEARLRDRAARKGIEPETLVVELVRNELTAPLVGDADSGPLQRVVDENGVYHEDRWQRAIAHLQQLTRELPRIPTEALTREALYQDHD